MIIIFYGEQNVNSFRKNITGVPYDFYGSESYALGTIYACLPLSIEIAVFVGSGRSIRKVEEDF